MDISDEIIKELKKETIEISVDYLDIGIGSLLQDTVMEKIPIISTFTKVYKLSTNLKTAFFYKKLLHFLIYMNEIDFSERINFLSKYIDESRQSENEIGEKILLTIDKLDEIQKTRYYVNFIRMYATKDEIDYYKFIRLCHILDKIFIGDLDKFKDMEVIYLKRGGIWHDGELVMALSNLGLIMWEPLLSRNYHGDDGIRITKIGEIFHQGLE